MAFFLRKMADSFNDFKRSYSLIFPDNEGYNDESRLTDGIALLNSLKMDIGLGNADVRRWALNMSGNMKQMAAYYAAETGRTGFDEAHEKCLLFEAPELLDSYMLFMESHREPYKRFYEPRRDTLRVVVQDLQDLEDGLLTFYGLSLPPRVGKSTTCILFLSWVMGRRPNSHNAMSGHSGMLADGFYDETLNLFTPEYRFGEVFPDVRLTKKSAEKKEITLNDPDRFATLTCRGIEGTWTGAVDISRDGYLYVDDLVRDREESLSPIRLENRYQDYLNVLVDRKNDGSRELMVGTRWNVYDPLGRVEQANKDNPLYRFRKIPALNENGESNFQYKYGVGFSTEYYRKMRDNLAANEWMAKFQQRPFVREGLLFPEDNLRCYNGVLPEGDSRILSACDVAWGGGDSLSMPIGREFDNGDIFIADWVFDKGKKDETIPKVAGRIESNGIKQINFESNNGGDMYCDAVSKKLEERNYKCSCTYSKAPGTMAKVQKIIAYSDDIIKHFVFLDKGLRSPEYQAAMEELITFVTIGKNLHDDAADSLAQLAAFAYGNYNCETRVIDSPI